MAGKKKVLIVEDNEQVALLYKEELIDRGIGVVLNSTGEGLIEQIKREEPDLIILDIMLPGGNGLDILQEIRKEFEDRIPVVICTARAEYKDSTKTLAADFYIVKSSNLENLFSRIDQLLDSD